MHILALTDIHGSYDSVEEILSNEKGYDAIVLGGDLTTHGTVQEAEQAIRRIKQFAETVVAVAGNMDRPDFESLFEDLGVSINGRGAVIDDVGFFGVSGSPSTPMHTPYELSEDEIASRAAEGWKQVHHARTRVFVPHAPPHGTRLDKIFLGKHVGSRAVRTFVEQHQPEVVICGHIHEARGQDTIGTTKMVNCGPAHRGQYAVISITDQIGIDTRG